MAKQVRAERTRQALIAAAAEEFDRRGYAGTSLSAVHRGCGVTMGALTFHFPTKADLAAAVAEEAETATREALAGVPPDSTLPPLAAFTLAVVRLLEEAPVRATARLVQERAVSPGWRAICRTALSDLAEQAEGLPACGPGPQEWELLAVYLTAGAEAALRAGHTPGEVRAQLRRLWSLALDGRREPGAAMGGTRPRAASTPAAGGCPTMTVSTSQKGDSP
ncbi:MULTISPECIES: TetR/AcrR family transcriptional regulator [Streptomyces]|uniref:TetR/AcrR family transcriptional regulator n=1 Tax=Streptomyces TaxID=1883 RepID=UPI000CD4C008|nr:MULTISPECIES: TetR/AcrR family transcriptional regulator [Streptomyces]